MSVNVVNLSFRRMQRKHLPEIMAIERTSFPAPWSMRLFLQELSEPCSHFSVLVLDDKVVGYGGYWLILDEAHITNIAIHPEHRGKGWGRHVAEYLLNESASLGAQRATLEVRVSNHIAISLYRSLGFISVAIRKGYYIETQEDALIMWKTDLKPPALGQLNMAEETS